MNTWEIEAVTDIPKFLAAVARRWPNGCVVSFEIHKAVPEAIQLYAKHKSSVKLRPLRDTGSPRTQLYYCVLSEALANDLELLLRNHPIGNVLWHIKCFVDFKMLFAFHDADSKGSPCMSSSIDKDVVSAIAASVGRTASLIETYYSWDKEHRPKDH